LKSGEGVRRDLPPTGAEWTRYCLDLGSVMNIRTGRIDFSAAAMNGFRLGGNPASRELEFSIRKVRFLKRK